MYFFVGGLFLYHFSVFYLHAAGFALLASYFFSVAKKSNPKTPPL